ncbi:MAG: hypothetical protein WC881_01885 [Elusimicrobiota bacterium]|jgi:hypothetical protein
MHRLPGSWFAAIFFCILAAAASAQEGAAIPASQARWLRAPKSLLYYDAAGNLAGEIGLGRWEDTGMARVFTKIIDGGTAADNRFAWTLEKRTSWNTFKTKVLDAQRTLRFFGPAGKELWSEDGPDFIPESAPLVFSQDGETCLIAIKRKEGWFAAVKTYIGNTPWEIGPFPRLDSLQISPNGRYAVIRWNDPEQSSMHSFVEIPGKARQDVPSAQFFLGRATVDDLGRAQAGHKTVFSFAPTPSKSRKPAPFHAAALEPTDRISPSTGTQP